MTVIFLVDLIINFWALGWKKILNQKKVLLIQMALQIYFWIFIIIMIKTYNDQKDDGDRTDDINVYEKSIKACMFIFFLWNLRVLDFLTELKFFNLILYTMSRLTKPFFAKLLSLYLLFQFYTSLGQNFYGGGITRDTVLRASPDIAGYYWLMNFNDFGYGLVTLFHIMVVNNWFVTTDMFCSVFGNEWPRVFFASFWVFCVLIIVNIVTASVIEVYSASEESVTSHFDKLDHVNYLRQRFLGMNDAEILSRVHLALDRLDAEEEQKLEQLVGMKEKVSIMRKSRPLPSDIELTKTGDFGSDNAPRFGVDPNTLLRANTNNSKSS